MFKIILALGAHNHWDQSHSPKDDVKDYWIHASDPITFQIAKHFYSFIGVTENEIEIIKFKISQTFQSKFVEVIKIVNTIFHMRHTFHCV